MRQSFTRRPFMTLSRRLVLLSVPLALVAGCSGSPKAKGPAVDFPPWEGEQRDLFDDAITPAAVGLAMDGSSPAHDPLLRLRAQSAELVARLRVQTVTRDSVGAKTSFVINLQVGQPPLMAPKLDDASIEISVGPDTGAFGIVQSLESSFGGRTFIGFVKRFAGEEGPVAHWHLTADTAEVAQVIQEVKALEDLAGQDEQESK